MSLRHAYTLLAPIYDPLVRPFTVGVRKTSLARLNATSGDEVLLVGVGSGLDIPYLPKGPSYTGVDLTPAMLDRARKLDDSITLETGDATALSYENDRFRAVILHLIVAVTPDPQLVLSEAARVLAPGGQILILDKFLKPDQKAPIRRMLSPLMGLFATRTDVVFGQLLENVPALELVSDEAALAGGWFRHIELTKRR